MPKSKPVLGYRSKTVAIMALHEAGKSDEEIAGLVGHTPASVRGTITSTKAKRRHRQIMPWQRDKALRILPKVFEVVAEAIGCTPSLLIEIIKHTTFPSAAPPSADVSDEPSIADTPAPVDDTTSIVSTGAGLSAGEEPKPADHQLPKAETDVLQLKPATQATWDEKISTGLVTLKDPLSGKYLNLDGSALTDDRRYIYRGTIAQARAMRNKNPIAKGLSFRTFSQPKA